jgi:hypothetical protein
MNFIFRFVPQKYVEYIKNRQQSVDYNIGTIGTLLCNNINQNLLKKLKLETDHKFQQRGKEM